MPRREPSAYVWDIRDACARIRSLTTDLDHDAYLADDKTRLAVERMLMILGEAVVQLNKADASMASELGEVSRMIAFRNILVHGYFALDHEKVWDVIENHVPALHEASERIWSRFSHLYPEDPSTS